MELSKVLLNDISKQYNQNVNLSNLLINKRDLVSLLVKLLKTIFVNSTYKNFQSSLENASFIIPEDQNDIKTKVAMIAMKNMIEHLKVFGYSYQEDYFSTSGLYVQFLKDLVEESGYNICDYNTCTYDNCEIEYGKHIKIQKIKASMK